MGDIRDSFSRLKKKLKYQLTGSERKPDATGTSGSRERADSAGLLPRPEPRVTAGDDHGGEGSRFDAGPSTSVHENEPNWRSTVSAPAKLLLRGVRDSADAFPPLKSVAGGLCFILENCEVRPSSRIHCLQYLRVPQRTKANKEAIEYLAPRVEALAQSLCGSVPQCDVKERERRKGLER